MEAGRRARPLGRSHSADIITRPPTAELRENQTDQDSLPPYDMLDAILERLVEREEPLASIVAAGFDREVVARIDRLLNIAEYKRRQAAPGVKVTRRNFGRDRRYPITNAFAIRGNRCPRPTTLWCRAPPAHRRKRLTDRSARRDEGRPDRPDRLVVRRGAGGGRGLAEASGAGAAAGAVAVVPLDAAVFLAGAVVAFGGSDIFLALSSVTMISPCCSAAALSSMLFSASDQVCPAALQEQDGLNSWRKRNAFGDEV